MVNNTRNRLDQNLINQSAWLAYMESLYEQQTAETPRLATFASDVFLGPDPCFHRIPSTTSFPVNIEIPPPCKFCVNQLRGLSFAAGPFWSTPQ
jgi:hypothetical protein